MNMTEESIRRGLVAGRIVGLLDGGTASRSRGMEEARKTCIAKACMESATMQYSAKDYFFMASLCHLTEACDKKEPMQDTKAAMTRSLGGGSPGHPESVHFPS